MEFIELIHGEKYHFSQIAHHLFLISAPNNEYILYKKKDWDCADEIPLELLVKLGAAIDSRKKVTT